jgi:saccharopine dehydrogenase-like NADP-dependent oxidoreductase
MKHILLFGAGKSATVLIEYLKELATEKQWFVTVADGNVKNAEDKTGVHPFVKAMGVDVTNDIARKDLISKADLVISMMPPALHYLIAVDCVTYGKHLLTASYINKEIEQLRNKIEEQGLIFLCEMGLDPGIDHMSAMQLIHAIQKKGGTIQSFKSHCGGLVAPESDDNPFHYKISWNPRNVVLAGKAGAVYKENNSIVTIPYEAIFKNAHTLNIVNLGELAYYANRDSLSYIPIYKLDTAKTFIRTTLRYRNFCLGWNEFIKMKLTDEEKVYDTDNMSTASFFTKHQQRYGIDVETLLPVTQQQLSFLGWSDDKTLINKGWCSAADVLNFYWKQNWFYNLRIKI